MTTIINKVPGLTTGMTQEEQDKITLAYIESLESKIKKYEATLRTVRVLTKDSYLLERIALVYQD